MKVCIPVAEYCGLESLVYGHFGSAPVFALVDSETMAVEPMGNRDEGHVHGQCSPVKALAGAQPDAVVVGGIGGGALMGLRQAGIKVYQATGGTVAEMVALLKNGSLKEFAPGHTCGGHGEGAGCHHAHG
jgi:predicted Fe-Mo cluster-binding NifX family protein